ncbi:MAG: hypothetical protein RIE52_11855 [Balneola sp.]
MYLLLKLEASLELGLLNKKLEGLPDERSDFQKRVDRVKQAMKKGMNVWDQLISVTAQNADDYRALENSDPVFIVKNYKARILQSG